MGLKIHISQVLANTHFTKMKLTTAGQGAISAVDVSDIINAVGS